MIEDCVYTAVPTLASFLNILKSRSTLWGCTMALDVMFSSSLITGCSNI